ncbi:hypothetical protein EG329_008638 [Mollisiaceae sp. DMI_Dod_QoI]|nr:hypothetical protein EG329_008638 [Helotiales sp. DMI_Dod_QoI]
MAADNSALSDIPVDRTSYVYQSLKSDRNIRILEVQGAESYDTTLTFKILEVSLDSPPEYFAISYCWEGQKPTQTVLCNAQALLVTINCEAALKRFRSHEDKKTTLLWIDAICINQSKEAVFERNRQVFMMGDVFATATEVWVWLGTDRLKTLHRSAVGMLKWLRDLSEAANELNSKRKKTKLLPERALAMLKWLKGLGDSRASKTKRASVAVSDVAVAIESQNLCYLEFHIPWLRRIWVLQEVVLSKTAFLCRDELVIDYRGVLDACVLIEKAAKTDPDLRIQDAYLHGQFKMFISLEATRKSQGSISRVYDILSSTRGFLSTDPRDKVFALHSLLTTTGLLLPPPDYTKNLETVYRQTTKAILLYGRGLTFLKQVNGIRRIPGHSSWIPDWSELRYPNRPQRRQGSDLYATGNSFPVAWISSDDSLLVCRGRILETVTMCAGVSLAHDLERLGASKDYMEWSRNVHPEESFWLDLLTTAPVSSGFILEVWNVHVLQKFVAFAFSTADRSQTEVDMFQDLFACLLTCVGYTSTMYGRIEDTRTWNEWRNSIMEECSEGATSTVIEPRRSSNLESQEDKQQTIWAGQEELACFRECEEALADGDAASVLQTQEFRAWGRICSNNYQAALHRAIIATAYYQTLFRTGLSKSLGSAPHSVREGDQIALLGGLDVPMVVRPLENGHFRLIAPCHVCGIMEGEAWDDSWDEGNDLDDLVFE